MKKKDHISGNESFTLIELLGVMSIIVMLTVIGMSSYLALTRGAALRSGVDHIRQTLMVTRQSAILKSRPAKCYFDEDNSSFIACLRGGRVTSTGGTVRFYDRYANFDEPSLVGGVVFKLPDTTASTAVFKKSKILAIDIDANSVLTEEGMGWATGDEYGWEICPEKFLPPGIIFDSVPSEPVVYNSRGQTTKEYRIAVRERINPNYKIVIIVRSLSGFIEISVEK